PSGFLPGPITNSVNPSINPSCPPSKSRTLVPLGNRVHGLLAEIAFVSKVSSFLPDGFRRESPRNYLHHTDRSRHGQCFGIYTHRSDRYLRVPLCAPRWGHQVKIRRAIATRARCKPPPPVLRLFHRRTGLAMKPVLKSRPAISMLPC